MKGSGDVTVDAGDAMETSDGIRSEDWEVIVNLAAEVANQSALDRDCRLVSKRLVRALDALEAKYGRLPSILSTKADYLDDRVLQLSLLKEAYVTAGEMSDVKNRVFISSDISEIYLEEFNWGRLTYWLQQLELNLIAHPDDCFQKRHSEMSLKLGLRQADLGF